MRVFLVLGITLSVGCTTLSVPSYLPSQATLSQRARVRAAVRQATAPPTVTAAAPAQQPISPQSVVDLNVGIGAAQAMRFSTAQVDLDRLVKIADQKKQKLRQIAEYNRRLLDYDRRRRQAIMDSGIQCPVCCGLGTCCCPPPQLLAYNEASDPLQIPLRFDASIDMAFGNRSYAPRNSLRMPMMSQSPESSRLLAPAVPAVPGTTLQQPFLPPVQRQRPPQPPPEVPAPPTPEEDDNPTSGEKTQSELQKVLESLKQLEQQEQQLEERIKALGGASGPRGNWVTQLTAPLGW